MDETIGCKIFAPEEVELVSDGEMSYLRVVPTRKRAMPILVPVTAEFADLKNRLEHALEDKRQLRFEIRELEGKTERLEHQLSEANALIAMRDGQVANQKAQLIEKHTMEATLLRETRALEECNARQTSLILEKDATIEHQYRAISELGDKVIEAHAEQERLRLAHRGICRRLHNLRTGILNLVQSPQTNERWAKRLHEAFVAQVGIAGYQERALMPWWNPVRWFGGGDSLPSSFFAAWEGMRSRDVQIRKKLAQELRYQVADDIKDPLEQSLLSVEESECLNGEQA